MEGPVSNFNYTGLMGETQDVARDEVFAKTMRGVFAATITLIRYSGADPLTEGIPYRKFYYNERGQVVKRLSFDETGNIEMKEESSYDDNGNIVSSRFITADNIVREVYDYNSKGVLEKYTYINPKMQGIKYELNDIDEQNRIVKTTQFGFLNRPELVSHFIYNNDNSNRYKYKHVTRGDGSTLMTFYYTYDSTKKSSNLTGLYGFYLTPEEVDTLLNTHTDSNDWEVESVFRSRWGYINGCQTSFERDEKIQSYHLEYGHLMSDGRIVTDRSDFILDEINGKKYPVRIIDWQTRFMEPCKVLKKYVYRDEQGNILNPNNEDDTKNMDDATFDAAIGNKTQPATSTAKKAPKSKSK